MAGNVILKLPRCRGVQNSKVTGLCWTVATLAHPSQSFVQPMGFWPDALCRVAEPTPSGEPCTLRTCCTLAHARLVLLVVLPDLMVRQLDGSGSGNNNDHDPAFSQGLAGCVGLLADSLTNASQHICVFVYSIVRVFAGSGNAAGLSLGPHYLAAARLSRGPGL